MSTEMVDGLLNMIEDAESQLFKISDSIESGDWVPTFNNVCEAKMVISATINNYELIHGTIRSWDSDLFDSETALRIRNIKNKCSSILARMDIMKKILDDLYVEQ